MGPKVAAQHACFTPSAQHRRGTFVDILFRQLHFMLILSMSRTKVGSFYFLFLFLSFRLHKVILCWFNTCNFLLLSLFPDCDSFEAISGKLFLNPSICTAGRCTIGAPLSVPLCFPVVFSCK